MQTSHSKAYKSFACSYDPHFFSTHSHTKQKVGTWQLLINQWKAKLNQLFLCQVKLFELSAFNTLKSNSAPLGRVWDAKWAPIRPRDLFSFVSLRRLLIQCINSVAPTLSTKYAGHRHRWNWLNVSFSLLVWEPVRIHICFPKSECFDCTNTWLLHSHKARTGDKEKW